MRLMTQGFERGNIVESGWELTGGSWTVATLPNLDTQGNGGSHSIYGSVNDVARSPNYLDSRHREGFFRAYVRPEENTVISLRWLFSGSDAFRVFFDDTTSQLRIVRGTSPTVASSVGVYTPLEWTRIEVHYYIANVGGFIRVYVDSLDYATPFVEYTGDTAGGADEEVSQFEVFSEGGHLDDIGWNVPSIEISGPAGALPATGADTVVTGGTSGATAEVHHVQVDLSGIAYRLIVHNVVGTFVAGETVTAGALTATAVHGLDPQSGAPGEGFVVYRPPVADGGAKAATGTDGDTVDNYLLLDDNPVDATTEGVISTAPTVDTFDYGTLPASAAGINAVAVAVHAVRDGTVVNRVQAVTRQSGSNTLQPEHVVVPESAGSITLHVAVNPATGLPWTVGEINGATEFGIAINA